MAREFEENVHYYLENGRVVFTALFHFNRGHCCGNGCRHCPYEPGHVRGNTVLNAEIAKSLQDSLPSKSLEV